MRRIILLAVLLAGCEEAVPFASKTRCEVADAVLRVASLDSKWEVTCKDGTRFGTGRQGIHACVMLGWNAQGRIESIWPCEDGR